MSNKYSGNCFICGEHVKSGQGSFQVAHPKWKLNTRWVIRCLNCRGKGNNADKLAIKKREHDNLQSVEIKGRYYK